MHSTTLFVCMRVGFLSHALSLSHTYTHKYDHSQVYHAMNGKLVVQAQRSIDEYAKTRAAVGVDAKVLRCCVGLGDGFKSPLGGMLLYR